MVHFFQSIVKEVTYQKKNVFENITSLRSGIR